MIFRLGDKEWISDIVDTTFGTESEGSQVHITSVISDSFFHQPGDDHYISLLGASFFSHLKGLVFDYTPGKERLGLVPRIGLKNKTGLLNPIFVSAGINSWKRCTPLAVICGLASFLLPNLVL